MALLDRLRDRRPVEVVPDNAVPPEGVTTPEGELEWWRERMARASTPTRPLADPLDCDSAKVQTTVGGQFHQTKYTYCIDSITSAGDGVYDVSMSCNRERLAGSGVGDATLAVTASVNGRTTQQFETKDCGFGFDGDFQVEAEPGAFIEVELDFPWWSEATFFVTATVDATNLPFADQGVAVTSCDLSMSDADPGESVEVQSTVTNLNVRPADVTLNWNISGAPAATRALRLEPGETRDLAVVATAPTSPGDHLVTIDGEVSIVDTSFTEQLYTAGTENVPWTGDGWIVREAGGGVITADKRDDHLLLEVSTGWSDGPIHHQAGFYTIDPIDLTDIDEVQAEFEAEDFSTSSYASRQSYFYVGANTVGGEPISNAVARVRSDRITSRQGGTLALDVSDLEGAHHVLLHLATTGRNTRARARVFDVSMVGDTVAFARRAA